MLQDNPLIDGLKTSGARITPQRIAICKWLYGNLSHPTAAEVYDALSSEFPTMSLATVYNTINLLEELDLVHPVVKSEDGSIRYDPDTKPHVNLVCMQCGQIIDLPDVDLKHIEASVAEQGFLAHDYSVVVHGVCAACRGDQED